MWFACARATRASWPAVMAFGAGVLISALAYELVAEAHDDGGLWPTVVGFAIGALVYVGASTLVDARGRRRGEGEAPSGARCLVGALVDGIPESVVLGTSVVATGGVSLPIVAAIAISNLPEARELGGVEGGGRRAGPVLGMCGRSRGRLGGGGSARLPAAARRRAGGHGPHHDHRGGRHPRHGVQYDDPHGVRARPGRDGAAPRDPRLSRPSRCRTSAEARERKVNLG